MPPLVRPRLYNSTASLDVIAVLLAVGPEDWVTLRQVAQHPSVCVRPDTVRRILTWLLRHDWMERQRMRPSESARLVDVFRLLPAGRRTGEDMTCGYAPVPPPSQVVRGAVAEGGDRDAGSTAGTPST